MAAVGPGRERFCELADSQRTGTGIEKKSKRGSPGRTMGTLGLHQEAESLGDRRGSRPHFVRLSYWVWLRVSKFELKGF